MLCLSQQARSSCQNKPSCCEFELHRVTGSCWLKVGQQVYNDANTNGIFHGLACAMVSVSQMKLYDAANPAISLL